MHSSYKNLGTDLQSTHTNIYVFGILLTCGFKLLVVDDDFRPEFTLIYFLFLCRVDLRYCNRLSEFKSVQGQWRGLNLKLCYSKAKRRKHLEVSVFSQLRCTVQLLSLWCFSSLLHIDTGLKGLFIIKLFSLISFSCTSRSFHLLMVTKKAKNFIYYCHQYGKSCLFVTFIFMKICGKHDVACIQLVHI